MLALALLVAVMVGWLLWEWRTGALTPGAAIAGRRLTPAGRRSGGALPTAARLLVDADATARSRAVDGAAGIARPDVIAVRPG